ESLNHVVAQITGLKARETIPDRILDRADAIELIDLSPEELLQWLREGKVYVPEQAERAVRKYFLPSDLTASRDLAPCETAEHSDDRQQPALRTQPGERHRTATERTTVEVSGGPLAEQRGGGAVVTPGQQFAEAAEARGDRQLESPPPARNPLPKRSLRNYALAAALVAAAGPAAGGGTAGPPPPGPRRLLPAARLRRPGVGGGP